MDIAARIKKYRQYLGLTQEQLASKAEINEKYYGRIERGESCPTIDYVVKLCDAMEMDIIELFLYEPDENGKEFRLNPRVAQTIVKGLRKNVDVHFNRDVIDNHCESVIWYHGFIGSMSFDEFELMLYAEGNIKGSLYLNYKVMLELNSNDVSNELKKYIQDDRQLRHLIEYMPYDEDILKEKNGNVFFAEETNWLTARLVNHNTREIINDDIILDADNIIEALSDTKMLFDNIF